MKMKTEKGAHAQWISIRSDLNSDHTTQNSKIINNNDNNN